MAFDALPYDPWPTDLLPDNATELETALAKGTQRFDAIPVPLRDLWRPETCPEALLPWLAWALSVDIWDDAWPVERKRYVCAESFALHSLKGTLEGIRRHVRLADAEVLRAVVPPSKFFPSRTMTDAERRAWLERYPQIRTYAFRDRGTAIPRALGLGRSFVGHSFLVQSDAAARIGRNSYLYEPRTDVETKLRTMRRTVVDQSGVAVDVDEVRLPGRNRYGFFPGSKPKAKTFLSRSTAAERIVTRRVETQFTERTDVRSLSTIRTGLQLIDLKPETVALRGTRTRQFFPRGARRMFLMASTAHLRLYERFYLFDPKRAVDRRKGTAFVGHVRLGMRPYHAELEVKIRGRRSRHTFGRFVRGFVGKANREPLEKARAGIAVSKAGRDKILLNTITSWPRQFRHEFTFDSGIGFENYMRGN